MFPEVSGDAVTVTPSYSPTEPAALSSSAFLWRSQPALPYTPLCCSRVGRMLARYTQKGLHRVPGFGVVVFCLRFGGLTSPGRFCRFSASLKKNLEDAHLLSKHKKVLNKNPNLLSHSSTPFCYFKAAYCQHSHACFFRL